MDSHGRMFPDQLNGRHSQGDRYVEGDDAQCDK